MAKNGSADAEEGGRRFSDLFAPITLAREQILDLLVPFRHSVHIRRHAASVVISRTQLTAAFFAVLVPLFGVVDWFVFPWPAWAEMAVLRLVGAGIFLALATAPREPATAVRAGGMLSLLLFVPAAFFLLSIPALGIPGESGAAAGGPGALVAGLYALMPNVVLAGLAVYPLTALEALLCSLPAFACAFAGMLLSAKGFDPQTDGARLWLMVLALGAAMFSGMSQLHYMSALVARATIDPLTGAFTRRTGGETLDLQFRLSEQQGSPFSVVFLDLDHFKSINDGYGHDEGDLALKGMAEALRSCLRRGDSLARWGGEEFVVLLAGTGTDGAEIFLDRLRARGLGLRPDGGPLTASIGVSERIADGAPDWPRLVELADSRMYGAKQAGRARAVLPGGRTLSMAAEASAA